MGDLEQLSCANSILPSSAQQGSQEVEHLGLSLGEIPKEVFHLDKPGSSQVASFENQELLHPHLPNIGIQMDRPIQSQWKKGPWFPNRLAKLWNRTVMVHLRRFFPGAEFA
jgi:hypothetical protein